MPLAFEGNTRMAVNIGVDFDAHSLWMGGFQVTGPSALSRGEFGAEVGVPRLLAAFARFGVKATFCVPTHTMATFPGAFAAVLEAGHEIAAHGCYHESIAGLPASEERRLLELAVRQHERHAGRRPRGFRAPSWEISTQTFGFLEELGFEWDSSLMGRDFHPYRPRPVVLNYEDGNTFGPPSRILELPVSWDLDDFPAQEYRPGADGGLRDTDVMLRRWINYFDFAYEREQNPMMAVTVHPQCIGRPHNMLMFERFLAYASEHEGTWFASLSEIYDQWADEDPLPDRI